MGLGRIWFPLYYLPDVATSAFSAPPLPHHHFPTIIVRSSSYNTEVGRVALYHMQAKLTLNGDNLNRLFAGANRIALRAFPIHSACSGVTLSINDVTMSIPSPFATVAALLSQGFSSHSMALTSSTCPMHP